MTLQENSGGVSNSVADGRGQQLSLIGSSRPLQAVSCSSCRLGRLCLPKTLDQQGTERLDSIVKRSAPYPKGKILYREGAPFSSVFVVRSGAVKTEVTTRNGSRRVTDFRLPSDLIGLGGVAESRRADTAITLEHSSVCEIPFGKLLAASRELPGMQARLMQLSARQSTRKQQLRTETGHYSATQTAVSFLLGLSARLERISLSAREFRLPLSRIDLASHLGLTVETVSRVFASLARRGLIQFRNREFTLISMDGLRSVLDED